MGDHQFGSFTQGIIDLLINTTGEFVTERRSSVYIYLLGLTFNLNFHQTVLLQVNRDVHLTITIPLYLILGLNQVG